MAKPEEDALPSKDELQLIAVLKAGFQEDLERLKAKGPLPGCFFGDLALTRVLRGNDGNVSAAKEWFARFLGRYERDGVAELVAEMEERLDASGSQFGSLEMLPCHEEVQKYVRFVVTAPKLSASGDVVWYMPMVDNDRWSLVAELEWSHWVRFARALTVLRCLELDRLSLKQKRLARVVLIVDLAECSLDLLRCKAFDAKHGEDVSAFSEQIAANIIRRTVIVNSPQVVDLLGGLARSFLPSKFRDKVNYAKGDGFRDASFVAEAGGKEQLKELYASRVGLLTNSAHLSKALSSEEDQGMPTEEELQNVAKLRERFRDELSKREAAGTLHSCFFGDLALTRVLRGNQGSLPQAIEWMHRSLAKMAECDVDGLVAELQPKLEASASGLGSLEMLPHYREVKDYYGSVYSASELTPKGDVLLYFPLSDYDRWGMMEELEWSKWVRFARGSVILRCLELQQQSVLQGRMVKCIMLVDVKDCSLDAFSHKSFDKVNDRDVSKFAEAVAANLFGNIIVVNPSWAISTVYTLTNMFIPRRIMEKLHFQRGDCLQDAAFAEMVGGKEQLEQLLASRQGLVAKNGYAARAFSSDMDDRFPTDREMSHIARIRERFKDEFGRREAEGLLHSAYFSDLALARVLRGNDNDLEQAVVWLQRFVEKAREWDLDAIVKQVSKNLKASGSEIGNVAMLPHYEEVREHFRCIFTAPRRTTKGDVIWYMPMSDIDREELMKKVDNEHLKVFIRSLLVLRSVEVDRLSHAQGRMVKTYLIMDAAGSGMGSTGMPPAPAFDALHAQHVWPFYEAMAAEVLGPCYVLNAPWIMVKGYNWFKALVPEKLSRKLHMLDGDGLWDAEFVELMGGEAQLRYLFSSRVGLVEGMVDASEGEQAISAGDFFEKRRDVKPGQEVCWSFSVQAGYVDGWFGTSDLDFGISAFWFPELGEAGRDPAPDLGSADLGEELRAEETYTAESGEVKGSYRATRAGVVLLRWSNAHSVLRRKSVAYSVSVKDVDAAPVGAGAAS